MRAMRFLSGMVFRPRQAITGIETCKSILAEQENQGRNTRKDSVMWRLTGLGLITFIIVGLVLQQYPSYVAIEYDNVISQEDAQKARFSVHNETMRAWTNRLNYSQQKTAKTYPIFVTTCVNVLENMTNGKWVRKIELPAYKSQIDVWIQREKEYEEELKDCRIERGIPTALWRPDHRCGYANVEAMPINSTWPSVGSWCDATGLRPCCSNMIDGICMKMSKQNCDCPECVDLRKFLHADMSEWIVKDSRCKWKQFNATEACDVIESSPYSDFHFIGDSYIRNMFSALLIILTGNRTHGAISRSTDPALVKKCMGFKKWYRQYCRLTITNMSDTMCHDQLCGGGGKTPNFSVTWKPYFGYNQRDLFLQLVKKLIAKPGSLIVLSVGVHMNCKFETVTEEYLGPALDAIEKYHGAQPSGVDFRSTSGRWPHIIFVSPPTMGLLKPVAYLKRQGNRECGEYSRKMKEFARNHGIPFLDLQTLTKFSHSFDGSHQGIAVNEMKNHILLNFISSSVK